MKTSRLDISKSDHALLQLGFNAMLCAIVGARGGHFPRLDPRAQFPSGLIPNVFAQAEASETMAGYILTARNKLASMGSSRKVRLNTFEFAACAFVLRLGLKEKLIPEGSPAKASSLASKLEKHRKRAKRATIKAIGLAAYKEQTEIWRRFLLYMHAILCYRPVFFKSKALPLMHRDGRETLFEYAKAVAPDLPPARLWQLVIWAKREVLRDRHPVTLGMLVSDETLGREFMARFIHRRDGPYVLAKEFQPLDVRQSSREERLKAAMFIDEPDESAPEVSVTEMATEQRHPTTMAAIAAIDNSSASSAALSVPSTDPQPVPSVKELAVFYTQWPINEFDPGNWSSITSQTQIEIWRPHREPKRVTAPKTAVSTDAEIRPDYLGSDTFEANNVYAMWGATWLTAKNSNPQTTARAAAEGFRLADEWERMNCGTQKDKLSQIYLRSQA